MTARIREQARQQVIAAEQAADTTRMELEVARAECAELRAALTDLRETIARDIEEAHNVGETLTVPVEYHLAIDVAADIVRGTS